MPSPHFGNAPASIGCLEPVRTDEQFRTFRELGGSCTEEEARADMRKLTGRQMGDLFLVKNGVGETLTWARAVDAGGRGVDITHGCGGTEEGEMIEKFAMSKHESKRLFASSWEDEQGKTHLDLTRVEAKLRMFAGLPLPGTGGDGRGDGRKRGIEGP